METITESKIEDVDYKCDETHDDNPEFLDEFEFGEFEDDVGIRMKAKIGGIDYQYTEGGDVYFMRSVCDSTVRSGKGPIELDLQGQVLTPSDTTYCARLKRDLKTPFIWENIYHGGHWSGWKIFAICQPCGPFEYRLRHDRRTQYRHRFIREYRDRSDPIQQWSKFKDYEIAETLRVDGRLPSVVKQSPFKWRDEIINDKETVKCYKQFGIRC